MHTVPVAPDERADFVSRAGLPNWACLYSHNFSLHPELFRKSGGFDAGFLACGCEDVELGYRLRSDAWNRGYATEASQGLILDGFTRCGVPCVVATTLETNQRSQRVLEKCGLKRTGQFRLPGFTPAAWRYELQKSDFRP